MYPVYENFRGSDEKDTSYWDVMTAIWLEGAATDRKHRDAHPVHHSKEEIRNKQKELRQGKGRSIER